MSLIDGTNELVPEFNELCEAQASLTKVAEDANQCSKEPKANFAQEGKPWCILNTYYFQVYAIYVVIYLSVYLSFQELTVTLDA